MYYALVMLDDGWAASGRPSPSPATEGVRIAVSTKSLVVQGDTPKTLKVTAAVE
jgi:lactam utilization protein B